MLSQFPNNGPLLLPERQTSTIINGWGKFCTMNGEKCSPHGILSRVLWDPLFQTQTLTKPCTRGVLVKGRLSLENLNLTLRQNLSCVLFPSNKIGKSSLFDIGSLSRLDDWHRPTDQHPQTFFKRKENESWNEKYSEALKKLSLSISFSKKK